MATVYTSAIFACTKCGAQDAYANDPNDNWEAGDVIAAFCPANCGNQRLEFRKFRKVEVEI